MILWHCGYSLLLFFPLPNYKWWNTSDWIVKPPTAFRWTSPINPWSMVVQRACMAEHCYRCAPPARVVGRRLRQEDTLRGGRGGAIVRAGPGAPCGFQIPSCDGRPLAPFQIRTISLNPLIPPNTHHLPRLSSETNTRLKYRPGLQVRGSLWWANTMAPSLIYSLKVQNC